MIILGVDPGTRCTGYGIIDFSKNQLKFIAAGNIQPHPALQIPQKLEKIYDELNRVIKYYSPDEYSVETEFYGKNFKSALLIGYARGSAILAAVHNRIPINEYSPREVKKALTGTGSASKEQVQYMIKNLLNLKTVKFRFDESDALALAVCHAFKITMLSKKSRNWKSFVEVNPELVIQ